MDGIVFMSEIEQFCCGMYRIDARLFGRKKFKLMLKYPIFFNCAVESVKISNK